MHRERKRRNLILASLVLVLMLMIGGYAAFESKLDIKGSTKVTTNWEVLITNVTSGTPTGNAENSKDENDNVILPTWDGLSASMSADLYEAGDSMEYIVTVTNRGNLDATLDEVLKTDSSNSAVIITYSGYAEKQKLRKNSSMDIKVKVEYNPEYTGGEVTGSSNITFSFKEADSKLDNDEKPIIENDTVISKDDKTITYDCTENGGTGGQTSIFDVGSPVDLNVQCTKEGYQFLGWNTDKNATSVISDGSSDHTTLNNKETDTTLYGIYQKDIKVTYKNQQLDDMNNWNFYHKERFNITYDEDTNMNDIAMTGLSDWELLYFPIETKIGTQYSITFDYDILNDYNPLSGYTGIGYQALTLPPAGDSISVQNEIGYLPTLSGSGTKTLTFTATKTITFLNFNFGMAADNQTVSIKLGNIRIKEENNNIVKNSDTCTIYNKTTSCDFAVPTAILDNDVDNTYYELDGWYIDGNKIENPGSSHTYTDSTIVDAKVNNLPVMMSGPDFQTKIDSVKSSITEIEFVDTDEVTPPTVIDNTTSWDVSAKQNGSVIAWLDGTKMYIGGKDGVIGNSDCKYLFRDMNVTSIDFNDYFDTQNVTTMSSMFYNCHNITELDLSSFNTKNVKSMYAMFDDTNGTGTSKLKSIKFGKNWDTSNVTNMSNMFCDCHSLESLNLSMFDTSNVTNMKGMFSRCYSLKVIYASDKLVTSNVTNSSIMFGDDTNIVGGNGTVYDSNYIDKTYALIDKEGQEGYFTDGSIPVIRNVSNVSTTNSITLTVDAWIPSGDNISKIEYSIDGGSTWYEQTNSSIAGNIYTFTNLDADTNYPIKIRVTSDNNKVKTEEYEIKTKALTVPTYIEETYGTVEITYPELDNQSCSNGLTCEYSLDDGSTWTSVNETTKNITYSTNGNLIARVSDGTNIQTSSYKLSIEKLSEKVLSDNGGVAAITAKGTPDFTQVATTDEGMFKAIDYDGNPTYYFRGAVENNYVRFADKYWRIIRVNGDGTVRMIYDGTIAHSNGESSTDRRVTTGAFNSWWSDNAYVGYMYGKPDSSHNTITEASYTYNHTGLSASKSYYFSTSYSFDESTNTFTLAGTKTAYTIAEYYASHNSENLYTCFSESSTEGCQRLVRVKSRYNETAMTVWPVEWSSTSKEYAHSNMEDSTVKDYLENTWYPANLTAYTSKLSGNTVFCNNRQISNYTNGTYKNQGYGIFPTLYGYTRFWEYAGSSISPSLACPQTDDRFTVDSSKGNGLQSAPVGLITADEVSMAGGKTGTQNTMYYLYTGHVYWTMSPSHFNGWAYALEMNVTASGELKHGLVYIGCGVRPVINLKSSDIVQQGSGTMSDPYIVN